ncbi:hypothetical protein [Persephonella sp.]
MKDLRDLRKLKVIFKKDDTLLDKDFFDYVLKNVYKEDEKNFLIGCRHTLERHYAEAIKWFQLSSCNDSVVMILLLSFKLGDVFLFEEYYQENIKIGKTFKKMGFKPYIQTESREYSVNEELLKELRRLVSY